MGRNKRLLADLYVKWECDVGENVWVDPCWLLLHVTYFRVSLLLQVEQAKQLTHQALLRAETTSKNRRKKKDMAWKYIWFMSGAHTHSYVTQKIRSSYRMVYNVFLNLNLTIEWFL